MKTLQLTDPYQSGAKVRTLQRLLVRAGYRIKVDGELGPGTAAAIIDAKKKLGYRKKGWDVRPTAGDRFFAALKASNDTGRLLVKVTKRKDSIRQKIAAYCRWSMMHEPQIHYAQERPMEMADLYRLPQKMDCSEHATKAYRAAGAPDPNGRGYDGIGYTGTLLDHGVRVPLEHAREGDLVIFGDGTGNHVAVLIEDGKSGNPMLCSHGQEKGPFGIRLKDEDRYQPGRTEFRNYLKD